MLLLLKYKRSIKSAKRLLLEFEVSSDSLLLPYLILFQHSFFHYIDQSIQSHCHNTEQNNRHEKPIHLKYLTGIDDQISKSAFGSEKFSDNDSHKTKSDIDFHIAYDCRNRGRQYNFCKRMPAVSVQCIYQFDLFLIDIDKGGIQIQDTSEDGDGHSGNNNCFEVARSHTIRRGASADFGRLFSTTRYGSSISDSFLLYQSKIAARMLSNMTSMKLINVSYKVIPI